MQRTRGCELWHCAPKYHDWLYVTTPRAAATLATMSTGRIEYGGAVPPMADEASHAPLMHDDSLNGSDSDYVLVTGPSAAPPAASPLGMGGVQRRPGAAYWGGSRRCWWQHPGPLPMRYRRWPSPRWHLWQRRSWDQHP